ncbi:F-box and associated interaction domain protein [Medicago truncatula]|uniref:F-box and associated interaction domain protein n=1 Tax=Medicago truncatula TaxID=3880 RepID=A0A072VIZ5_MEDTR|nr:F-box and associated interaction domain protein [Medicago truncatula]
MAPSILKFFRKKKKTIQKFEKSMAPTNEKVSIYVPDDITFSILSKLPLKSVNRFTCVCKSWTLLFENSYFMNMFIKNMALKYHSLTDESCLLLNHFEIFDGGWKLYLLSGERFENKVPLNWPSIFDQNNNYYYCLRDILGYAIDGTLCINHHSTIFLWNPTTEDLNIVPKNKARFHDKFKTEFIIHGFVYDQIKDDYNIIHCVEYIGDYFKAAPPGPYWDIYSLRRNSWKKLHVDMRRWIDRRLDLLNGHVTMISSYETRTSYHISISILGELDVKESWTKLFDVGPLSDTEYPIGVCKKGNIFFLNDDYELSCLDLTTGIIEKTGVNEVTQAVIYDKSFFPIGGINN